MISNRTMVYRANISFILYISDILYIALKLSGNLGFNRIIESTLSYVKCFAINETYKDIGIVKAPIIVNITINRTIGIVYENFGYRHSYILCNINYILGLDNVDISAKLDNGFR